MNVKKFLILGAHALVGWGLCGAIIGIFRGLTSMENTLIIHAIGVPIIFGLLAWLYFARFNYTTPLQTALFFFIFAILMDFFVIALFVEKSFAMFASLLGTWIPFGLIFLSTYLVGIYVLKRKRQTA
jgi:peptidoglycan biosynthesis protein MviN/MurJ (putative lipid II flippase)